MYPSLITLLNYIQKATGSKVVITSGHRCPTHQLYLNPFTAHPISLYSVGAAVDFYVRGYEHKPEYIVSLIQKYYAEERGEAYHSFYRIETEKGRSITPWVNKEVCILLSTEKEGRNYDNAHSYPYISLHIHHDSATNTKIVATWQEALVRAVSQE